MQIPILNSVSEDPDLSQLFSKSDSKRQTIKWDMGIGLPAGWPTLGSIILLKK